MNDLAELAERCEQAKGPDRELDCLIHEWRFPELTPAMRGMYYGEPTGEYFRDEGETTFRAPAYTASLDAAMSLVPEGWDGALYLATDTHKPEVQLETPTMRRALSIDDERAEGRGGTLALALCAAALRARQSGDVK